MELVFMDMFPAMEKPLYSRLMLLNITFIYCRVLRERLGIYLRFPSAILGGEKVLIR